MDEELDRVRLDRWLWAARFYKTRSLAAQAVEGGKVQLNGDRVKRSKQIVLGDEIRIRKGPYEYRLEVTGLSERRGPATEAQRLYREDPASRKAREELAELRKLEPEPTLKTKGRPTKKERRDLMRHLRKLRGRDL